MLSKKYKFATADFLLIKNLKSKKHFTNIGVFCVYNTLSSTQTASKFAVVLTKKIFKTAVLRNKHKRYFYSSVQEILRNSDNTTLKVSLLFYPNKQFKKSEVKVGLVKILNNS